LSGEGKGGPAGHARISSRVRLEADGAATILHYDVKADIGGKLAQLGGALVEKTAQKLAGEFFANFETLLNPAGDSAPPEQQPSVTTPTVSPASTTSAGGYGWMWVAAALALVGLVVELAR
jgi:hypothetical protein